MAAKHVELKKMVFKAMGVEKFETPLEKATHPDVWAYLNSGHHEKETPILHMSHNRLKLPEEHAETHPAFSMKELEWTLKNIPEIHTYLEQNPKAGRDFKKFFQDAVFFHQVKSPFYWTRASGGGYLHTITASAEGIPPEMNNYNALQAAKALNKMLRKEPNRERAILDVGTGNLGGTIMPVVKKLNELNPEAVSRLKLILNCVQPELDKVKQQLVEQGVKEDNIMLVQTTFYALSQAMGVRGMPEEHPWPFADEKTRAELRKLKGKIDVIVSGASLNNLPRSSLTFDTMHALLGKGGKAFLWDWGGFDITQNEYTQKELNRTIRTTQGKKITVRDNLKGFWRFWLYHHGYIDPNTGNEEAWKKLERYTGKAKTVNVYEWFNKNFEELEKHRNGREFTTLGFANRAYRTPEDVNRSALKSGFKINAISYPLAHMNKNTSGNIKWDKPNPRFVTWHAELEKPKRVPIRTVLYKIGGLFRKR